MSLAFLVLFAALPVRPVTVGRRVAEPILAPAWLILAFGKRLIRLAMVAHWRLHEGQVFKHGLHIA